MSTPVSVERVREELDKLKKEMDAGNLGHGEYDQRLAAMIRELRDRGIEGDRTKVTAMLDAAYRDGTITTSVKSHLENKLGLT